MLDFSQMLFRLVVALALGILIGIERELAGKEAGIRTAMMVAGGSALFAMIGVSLPYLVALSPEGLTEVIARNAGYLDVIANIVIGIGFIGAGIIIKTEEHVHGLTTAAVIWTTAAVGTAAGLGLLKFALVATAIISGLLYILRIFGVSERINSGVRH